MTTGTYILIGSGSDKKIRIRTYSIRNTVSHLQYPYQLTSDKQYIFKTELDGFNR